MTIPTPEQARTHDRQDVRARLWIKNPPSDSWGPWGASMPVDDALAEYLATIRRSDEHDTFDTMRHWIIEHGASYEGRSIDTGRAVCICRDGITPAEGQWKKDTRRGAPRDAMRLDNGPNAAPRA